MKPITCLKRQYLGCLVALFLSGTLYVSSARAEFTVCNQTLDVINLAVGRDVDEGIQTEGWWTIGANRCVDVIRTELKSRYIYVYAIDVFGQPVLQGNVDMCIASKRFSIRGTESCWQRGHKSAKFQEVDTQDTVRWTLFIRQGGAG